MNASIRNLLAPGLLAVVGLFFVIFSAATGQNSIFLLGASGVLLAGIVALLNAMDMFKKGSRLIVLVVLLISSAVLAGLNYRSIMDPIEFNQEKKRRYVQGVQKLKDLRMAQLAYKSAKGQYAKNIDSLAVFIQFDSIAVVKSFGSVPDTLTEAEALEQGIIRRDTTMEWAQSAIFTEAYMKERDKKVPFDAASMTIIPFSDGEKFVCNAGEIERNKVKVQVFEIIAPSELILKGLNKRMIDREESLAVGSMSEPSTSGNWGE
jgi:hypothetical protein